MVCLGFKGVFVALCPLVNVKVNAVIVLIIVRDLILCKLIISRSIALGKNYRKVGRTKLCRLNLAYAS